MSNYNLQRIYQSDRKSRTVYVKDFRFNIMNTLQWRHDLYNHSPDGFNWGYCGSGPAQLALALTADATGDDKLAMLVYIKVKNNLVARLPQGESFLISSEDVLRAAELVPEPTRFRSLTPGVNGQ